MFACSPERPYLLSLTGTVAAAVKGNTPRLRERWLCSVSWAKVTGICQADESWGRHCREQRLSKLRQGLWLGGGKLVVWWEPKQDQCVGTGVETPVCCESQTSD